LVVVLNSKRLANIDIYFPTTAPASPMYVGRFVVVSPEVGAYRVSSRSFPNRKAVDRDGTVTVGPTADAPETDNPYISYNAVQVTDRGAVVGNGSHVDPIAEKLELGYPARDALAEPLLALDFEKDDYDTPRVAGIVGVDSEDPSTNADGPGAVVGTVRRDALLVEEVTEPTLVATYEKDSPEPFELDATDAAGAAREVYDLEFEHAVCAAGVAVDDGTFDVAVHNG
jgi:IMP cyclohydrolase